MMSVVELMNKKRAIIDLRVQLMLFGGKDQDPAPLDDGSSFMVVAQPLAVFSEPSGLAVARLVILVVLFRILEGGPGVMEDVGRLSGGGLLAPGDDLAGHLAPGER